MILIGGLQKHQAIKTNGICTTITEACGAGGGMTPMVITTTDGQILEDEPVVIQRCGDRGGNGSLSVHNYSNCLPSNPMSDRGQLVLLGEEDEKESDI